ncbi:unnamed protein product [Cutaneotrichosporon oleaginosum]
MSCPHTPRCPLVPCLVHLGAPHLPPLVTPLFGPLAQPIATPAWPQPPRTRVVVDWPRPPTSPFAWYQTTTTTTTTTWVLWRSTDSKIDRLRRLQPVFLAITAVFAVVEGCITAYLVARNNDSFRDRTKFLLFASWWTVVFNVTYIVLFYEAAGSWVSSVLSNLVYVCVTWIFWLCGAAAFTQAIGGGERCNKDTTLLHCGQNVATEAFAWIQFILFAFFFAGMCLIAGTTTRRGDKLSTPIAIV